MTTRPFKAMMARPARSNEASSADTSGAAASEGDPILEQDRAKAINGLLKPALQKAKALAKVGRVSESNQAVPEEKRRPVHNFVFGNILCRTRF